MAYRIQTIEDVTTKSEIGLGVDLSFGNPGIFKTLFTSNDQAKANIRNLLLTRKGERYNQLNFGTNLLSLVFLPSNDELKELISAEISAALNFWLPYIVVQNLEILNVDDDPSLLNTTKIQLTYTVDGFSTDNITIIAKEDSSTITIE
jgi:phage baseplate assembly protein W|tara:strand:- start:10735 stop:11178 length:444 start_codon:yes stop_codon:yes gene_type:complete